MDIPLSRATPSPSVQILRVSAGSRSHYHASSINRYLQNKRSNLRLFGQRCTTNSIYPTLTLNVSMTIKQSVGTSQGRLSARKSSLSSIFFLAMGMRSPFGDRCSATSVNACRRKLRHGLALRRTNRNGPGGRWLLDRMRKRDNDEREFVVRPRTTVPSLAVSALDHRRISPTLTVRSFRDSVHAFHRRFVYARPLFAGN